jgi:hypothetical protein
LRVIQNDRDIGSEFSQDWPDYSFRLCEHRGEQVFRLYLLVSVSLSKFNCALDCFLRT